MRSAQVVTRPGGLPLIGDYVAFRRDRLEFWTEAGSLGPLVRVRFGAQEFWVVTDPEITEHILLSEVKSYPRDRRLMALNRGPGPELMFNTDRWEEWKWRRRVLTPAFHRDALAGFADSMVGAARTAADRWVRSGRIDLQESLRSMTMGIILDTMFSVTRDEDVARLQESFEKSSEVVSARASAPLPIPWWLPTPANVELRRLTRYRWATLRDIVVDRLRSGDVEGDLLDLLIAHHTDEKNRRFEVIDLVGEMSGIVFAGHETTAETQTWLFALLSRHPEVEERVMDEIEHVLGDRDPRLDDLGSMPYVDQVIQETMRLYPPVYLTIREADDDHEVAGFTIPAGTRLVINIRGLHLDPVAWDRPRAFDPDRFGPEHAGTRHRFQYIPFLAGPKKCLGDSFAMMEMRLAVPTILRRIELEPARSQLPEPKAGFTMSVDGGMPMRVSPRGS